MGSKTVMGEAVEAMKDSLADARAAAEPEQMDLLPVAHRVNPTDPDAVAAAAAADRRAGRPKGAENKSTGELRRFITQVFGSPTMQLMQWAQLSPEELAARLGCSVADAFDRKMALLDKVQPYVHARVAPSDDRGNSVPIFNIGLVAGGVPAAIQSGQAMPWDYLQSTEQNQRLIEGQAVESQNEESQK